MDLELSLLLETGRAADVVSWTGPEQAGALGGTYHWLRAQTLAALGDYDQAEREVADLAGAGRPGHGDDLREIIAFVVTRAILDEQPLGGTLPQVFWPALTRVKFRNEVTQIGQSMRDEANAAVLRGLLLMEEGQVEEAEAAFSAALALCKDEAAARSGAGLDFTARRSRRPVCTGSSKSPRIIELAARGPRGESERHPSARRHGPGVGDCPGVVSLGDPDLPGRSGPRSAARLLRSVPQRGAVGAVRCRSSLCRVPSRQGSFLCRTLHGSLAPASRRSPRAAGRPGAKQSLPGFRFPLSCRAEGRSDVPESGPARCVGSAGQRAWIGKSTMSWARARMAIRTFPTGTAISSRPRSAGIRRSQSRDGTWRRASVWRS